MDWNAPVPAKRRPRFISRRRVHNPRFIIGRYRYTVLAWEADSQPGNPGRQSYRDNVPLEQESRLRIRVTRSGYADRVPSLDEKGDLRVNSDCASSKRSITSFEKNHRDGMR